VAPNVDITLAAEAIALFTYGHVQHRKKYWRMVACDLDFSKNVLDAADGSENWPVVPQRRTDRG
jgi:hypothetical protein